MQVIQQQIYKSNAKEKYMKGVISPIKNTCQ